MATTRVGDCHQEKFTFRRSGSCPGSGSALEVPVWNSASFVSRWHSVSALTRVLQRFDIRRRHQKGRELLSNGTFGNSSRIAAPGGLSSFTLAPLDEKDDEDRPSEDDCIDGAVEEHGAYCFHWSLLKDKMLYHRQTGCSVFACPGGVGCEQLKLGDRKFMLNIVRYDVTNRNGKQETAVAIAQSVGQEARADAKHRYLCGRPESSSLAPELLEQIPSTNSPQIISLPVDTDHRFFYVNRPREDSICLRSSLDRHFYLAITADENINSCAEANVRLVLRRISSRAGASENEGDIEFLVRHIKDGSPEVEMFEAPLHIC